MNFFRSFFATKASPAAMSNTKTKVQHLIDDNSVVVFSKSYCPYCAKTKSTLKGLNAEFQLLELDQLSDGSDIQEALREISGQRTVPNIFIKQQHIGGNSELSSLASADKLEGLLQDAGALKA